MSHYCLVVPVVVMVLDWVMAVRWLWLTGVSVGVVNVSAMAQMPVLVCR